MKNKVIIVGLVSTLSLLLGACNSTKFLKELPFHYPNDALYQSIIEQRNKVDAQYAKVDENLENLSDEELFLKEKYSIILKVYPKEITNYKLYAYIDDWLGTPYQKKALEKQVGVDASYFIQALFSEVYDTTFPKTANGIFRSKSIQLFTGRNFLKEGDILFFRYDKFNPISDVGLYLGNNRILACTNKGLNIYDFNDSYFQLRYIAAGRLKKKK